MSDTRAPKTEELQAYIKGRLDASQREEIEKAIRESDQVRADYLLQKQIAKDGVVDEVFPGDLGWAKLSKAIDQQGGSTPFWQKKLPIWQTAASIAASLVVWQGLITPIIDRQTTGSDAHYEMASANKHIHALKVRFSDAATIGEITDLLAEMEGDVVEGPGALGLYTVSFENEHLLAAARGLLEEHSALVESVYPQH